MILAFRRDDSPFSRAEFTLSGLEPASEYLLENADTGETQEATGQKLIEGMSLTIDEPRQSRLIFYRRKP